MKRTIATLLAVMILALALPCALADSAEPVVLTAMWESTRPDNEHTDLVHKYILDNLGIDLQLSVVSEKFNQQLALVVGSSEIPDIIWMNYDTYVEYAREGLFADITDAVKNYDVIMDYVDTNGESEYCWQRMTINGKVYGVPTRSVNATMYSAGIRQDWLDNLGLEVPETLDELTEVLRAFTEDDPDQNDANDTYGISCTGLEYMSVFFGAFGATYGMDYFLEDDGTVTTNVISDNFKQGLEYIKGLYDAGYMDPEVFTNSGSQTYEKFATSVMGYWPNWWSNSGSVYLKYGFADNNPTGEISVIQPVKGSDGLSGLPATDPIYKVVAISRDCKNIDKALELINWECTPYGWYTVQCGIEGDYFEMDENSKVTWYWGLDGKNRKGDTISDMELYKFIENLGLQAQLYTLDQSNYGAKRTAGIAAATNAPVYKNLFLGLTTEEYTKLNSELKTYYTNQAVKFIMGELSLENDWDNYVSTYLSMGGDTVRQSLLDAYNEWNGTSYSFN